MTVDLLELEPKVKRAKGERCCEPVVYPDVEREQAQRMAAIAKAIVDPVRLQLVDVLRKHAGKVCVCELVPLFDLAQPTVSHHLRVLREAGLIESESAACGRTTTCSPAPWTSSRAGFTPSAAASAGPFTRSTGPAA